MFYFWEEKIEKELSNQFILKMFFELFENENYDVEEVLEKPDDKTHVEVNIFGYVLDKHIDTIPVSNPTITELDDINEKSKNEYKYHVRLTLGFNLSSDKGYYSKLNHSSSILISIITWNTNNIKYIIHHRINNSPIRYNTIFNTIISKS